MLQWFGTTLSINIRDLLRPSNELFTFFTCFISILISIFFQHSKKMSAQAEPAAPALRPLTQFAESLVKKKPSAAEKKKNSYKDLKALKEKRKNTAVLLKNTDRLLYDKLRLLPDARTGQNLNFFLSVLTAVLVAVFALAILQGDAGTSLAFLRDSELGANPATASILPKHLLLYSLQVITPGLLLLLIRKNREFYIDLFALFILIFYSIYKLFCCRLGECCMGIPVSWGVYNSVLDEYVFPVQLLESVMLGLFVFLCIWFMLKSKHYRPGRCASLVLILYAVSRFFVEHLRYHGPSYRFAESQPVLLGLTMAQLVCICFVLLAVVWLLVLPLEKKLMDALFDLITRRLPWIKQAETAAPVPAAKEDVQA